MYLESKKHFPVKALARIAGGSEKNPGWHDCCTDTQVAVLHTQSREQELKKSLMSGNFIYVLERRPSYNHRMVWVGKDLKAHQSQPLPWAGCPPSSGCPGPVQPGTSRDGAPTAPLGSTSAPSE